MSRGNRGILFAIGLTAALAAVMGVALWPHVPKLQSYSYEHPRNEQYQPGGANCEPSKLASTRGSENQATYRDECSEKAEAYRQTTDDLIQQTRAANAAEAQTSIAGQGLWTAWFQTVGGFLTLAAAVAAAWYARDAAKAGRANYRAFIAFESGYPALEAFSGRRIEDAEDYWHFQLRVGNMGRSPMQIHTIDIDGHSELYDVIIAPGAFDKTEDKRIMVQGDRRYFNCFVQYSSVAVSWARFNFRIWINDDGARVLPHIQVIPGDTDYPEVV